ncbi:MAG: sigma-54-dependent Fis family transcriptional regulator [Acidobacteria bacterium]|nr:sigma-54-dependent Fis family transcriptional regulator [Acidobacteriota bacterium]MBV9477806.1 sigma-54-dependent Fis family transcriptional regulator [Acidobacteriota bacterium]
MKRMLIVEDKESLAHMLREAVEADGFEADVAPNGSQAQSWLAEGRRYVAVLTDLRLPGADGIAVLRQAKESDPELPVIVMTAYGTIENAVEAMKLGAYDFIQKPIDVDHLSLLLRRCREHRELRFENLLLKDEFQKRYGLPAIVGDSRPIVEVSHAIQRVAPTDSTVLLQGESGTGKELFARAIHQLSPRRDRPFVAINCAAIPDTLIENELFGHEKGAFTGATARQLGKFELADSGTIFLDEIGELGFGVQSKILRVLQERRFERIGGTAPIDVDLRVICATNRDLGEAVRRNTFRDDLYFRIHVFPVTIPPLRARREDIDALVDFFLQRFARELARPGLKMTDEARALLRAYDWPGNIRELQNCIERAAILCDRNTIEPRDISVSAATGDRLRDALDLSGTLSDAAERALRAVERVKIAETLERSASRNEAAEALGISARQLAAKLKELGLE